MNNKINSTLMTKLLNVLEQKENSIDKIKELIQSLWTLREALNEDVCSYSFLFSLRYKFIENGSLPIKLKTDTKDITINLENRTITILSYAQEKEVIIQLNPNEISDELWDFLFSVANSDSKLDLSKLEENYTSENNLDLSGIW